MPPASCAGALQIQCSSFSPVVTQSSETHVQIAPQLSVVACRQWRCSAASRCGLILLYFAQPSAGANDQ
jgi:hypothetical protein